MAPGLCSGCQKKQGEFQCPLCQAAELDGGYFCSQECFAKNFVGHRDTVHGSGTVRAKRTAAEKTTEAAAETRKKTDRKRSLTDTQTLTVKAAAQDEAANAEDLMPKDDDFSDDEERDAYTAALKKELDKRTPLPIWPVWPGVDALGNALHVDAKKPVAKGAVFMTTPAVVFDAAATGSIEVRCPAGCSLHHAALFAAQAAADFSALYRDKTARVVIVAGSQPSAHAVAWAARCRRTPAALIVSLHDERLLADQLAQDFVPTEQRIVIASQAALASHHLVDEADDVTNATAAKRRTGGDAAPAVSQLVAVGGPSLLITLPDVTEHEFLQPLGTRAVFILSAEAPAAAPAAAAAAKPSASPAKGKGAKQPAPAPSLVASQQPTMVVPDARTVVAAPLDTAAHTPKANADYDNKLSHLIVLKGDMTAAINHITRIYNGSKSRCEHVLAATLLSDWGAQSSRHAHHKLAVLLRLLVEASVKMATSTKVKDPQSLAHIAARCVVRAVKHLEPIDEASRKARGQSVEDVFLDATIAYCFSHIPKSITDELAESWGLSTVGVIGNGALGHADRLRAVAMHRLRALYAPRLGTTGATFIGMLHHCIADASLRHALSVKDVRDATVWDWVCAPLGDLHEFLLAAQLVHRPEDMTSASGYTRTGAKVSKTQRNKATEALSADFVTETTVVAPHPTAKCPKIKRLEWPVRGARDRRRKLMRAAALDELLSAMPSSKNIPIYLGDIGNLIGKWTTFNARHNGYLPITLQAFIEEHPEEFRIVGNVVTRVKDSVTQQIKLRFDNDEHEDDSDDERRKNKKHRSEKFKISKDEIRTRRGAKLAQQKLFDEKPNMPRRSIKKKLKHLRNQSRFNKNHKQIDASARVPGYVKPTPKKLSGRGKKKNARLVKR